MGRPRRGLAGRSSRWWVAPLQTGFANSLLFSCKKEEKDTPFARKVHSLPFSLSGTEKEDTVPMKEILRRTWAEIDLDALARDFQAVREAANPQAKVCCVVKADAYGHGAVRIAREFEELGADWFAVSNLEEALQLRLGGIQKPILVLGYTPPEEAAALSNHHISQCVYSLDYAR